MPSAILPWEVKAYQNKTETDYNTILGLNPKTDKNKVQTYAHHLLPSNLSGAINVCPGAGNCKAICLHFAGNPAYMKGKHAKRFRQTVAFSIDNNNYLSLLFLAISKAIYKSKGDKVGFRLNATSDIKFESLPFHLSPDVADFANLKFKTNFEPGRYNSLLELFLGKNVIFYDYTKIKRNWQKCRELNYHLTVSFDGNDNKANHAVCRDAIKHGVNIAACFNIKKGQDLPPVIRIADKMLPVIDGDISDSRFDDLPFHAVGLRFKYPRGTKYNPEDVAKFCIL